MATYVNNLRLTELATGEGSGTWGTTTNTNLELIGEALGHGSETIANASTHTITVADGTSDSARSFYLICAGGGQACTVTLAPNTLNKVWMIENTTSYTLTFSQGSGANVAVAAGQVKMIATNGAGAGAVVYDLLTDVALTGTTTAVNLSVSGTLGVTGVLTGTSLDISGDIDVDGTTNLDVVDIDGAVDMATTLQVTGAVTINNAGSGNGLLTINGATGSTEALIIHRGGTEASRIGHSNSADLSFYIGSSVTERMRLSSIGGLTVTPAAGGHAVFNEGGIDADFRVESDGNANMFFVDASANAVNIGSIKVAVYAADTSSGYIADGGNVGIRFSQPGVDDIVPCDTTGADRDNAINFGSAGSRWGTIFAGTGTINTSDQNEKQDVAELSESEQRVAVAAKGLLRKFRWKESVAKKGDAARTHIGIMAQDLQAAFAAEGLDASDYAMWCSDTWVDKETGEEHTRMGVRYSELLAFIISAI